MSSSHQIFLLSPANCSGKRAGFLLRQNARSVLAGRLRSEEGATIGEVFTFMSGLYFRGKLAYASAFANPPDGCSGVQVIVPGLGLCSPRTMIDLDRLRAIARVPVDPRDTSASLAALLEIPPPDRCEGKPAPAIGAKR